MLQLLVMIVEWIAIAALAFLGVKYDTSGGCSSATTPEYQTIRYLETTADLLQPAMFGADCINAAAEAKEPVYLIRA